MNTAFTTNLLTHIFILTLLILGGWILGELLKRILRASIKDVEKQFRYTRIMRRILSLIVVFLVLVYLGIAFGDRLLAGLAVIATALILALRESVLSIVGWLHILVKAPFQLDDRIEINGVTGDVLDIRLFTTTLMEVRGWDYGGQSTGRFVRVPNNWVILHAVKNFTHGFDFIWNEITYIIAPESDWRKAREIMQDHAEESSKIIEPQVRAQLHVLAQELLLHWTILTPFVYVRYKKEGVELTLRYLTKVLKRRATEHAFHLTFIEEFEKENIKLG